MNSLSKIVVLSALALIGSTHAVPQQAVPPPPRPADAGPTLDATLSFIQQKMSGIGSMNYANYIHDNKDGNDWIVQKNYEISNVTSNPSACMINFRQAEKNNGKSIYDNTGASIPFRDAEDVVVLPIEQAWKEADSKSGNTTWSYRSDPEVYVMRVRRKNNGGLNDIFFFDSALADRVAKAVVHAIELCGGGNKDPF